MGSDELGFCPRRRRHGFRKAEFRDLSITKNVDLSSSGPLKSVALGKHFPEAKIIVRKAGGDRGFEYYTLTMTNVMVTSYQAGGSGAEDRLTESVTLNFASVEVKYRTQDARGRAGEETTFRFDISQNSGG